MVQLTMHLIISVKGLEREFLLSCVVLLEICVDAKLPSVAYNVIHSIYVVGVSSLSVPVLFHTQRCTQIVQVIIFIT